MTKGKVVAIAMILSAILPTRVRAAGASAPEPQDDVVRSQFFFQPSAWQTSLEPEFSYSSFNVTATISGASAGESDVANVGFITLERGLSRLFSVGASANYGQETQNQYDSSTGGNVQKMVGLGDISVFGKGLVPIFDGSVLYALNLEISPGNNIQPSNNSTGNRYSGGASITPTLGYQGRVSDGNILGLLLKYQYNTNRSVSNGGGSGSQTFVVTGGNTLTLTGFYELQLEKWAFDLDLSLGSMDEELTNGSQLSQSSAAFMSLGFEAVWKMRKNLQGLIQLVGTDFPGSLLGNGPSGTAFLINPYFQTETHLAARFFF